jgi:PIN domain nuclease of toxin-antitoxin system
VTTVVVDTHVLHWWTAEPERLSRSAAAAVEGATEIAVAGITWFELAWLADHDRIVLDVPVRSWLDGLAADVRTIPISPAIAATALALPDSFLGDPADRLIYATAIEHGWRLVTKDRRLRSHRHARPITVW